jgi:ribosomal protein S18 acetylase RimI-like enzyme
MSKRSGVRQATIDDLPRLKEIIGESFPLFFRYFAAHSVADLGEPTLVFQVNGEVVAFAKQTQFCIKQVKYGCLLWIAVNPEHRRQGTALALTNAALDWEKNNGASVIFASVQRSNKASLGALGKAGFVRIGFGSLRCLFGWRVFQFLIDIWFAPGELVLAHF